MNQTTTIHWIADSKSLRMTRNVEATGIYQRDIFMKQYLWSRKGKSCLFLGFNGVPKWKEIRSEVQNA